MYALGGCLFSFVFGRIPFRCGGSGMHANRAQLPLTIFLLTITYSCLLYLLYSAEPTR